MREEILNILNKLYCVLLFWKEGNDTMVLSRHKKCTVNGLFDIVLSRTLYKHLVH